MDCRFPRLAAPATAQVAGLCSEQTIDLIYERIYEANNIVLNAVLGNFSLLDADLREPVWLLRDIKLPVRGRRYNVGSETLRRF